MHDPPRILIVDDNETNRCLLATRLGAEGYQTTEAENGERALAAVLEVGPDVVLLDVMMPKIDGFEVCRRFASFESLRSNRASSAPIAANAIARHCFGGLGLNRPTFFCWRGLINLFSPK